MSSILRFSLKKNDIMSIRGFTSSSLKLNSYEINTPKRSTNPRQSSKEYIYGYASILASLQARKRKIFKLAVLSSAIKEENSTETNFMDTIKPIRRKANRVEAEGKRSEIIELAKAQKVPVVPFKRHQLDQITSDSPHQGLVLEVETLKTPILLALSTLDKSTNKYDLKLRDGKTLPGPLVRQVTSTDDPEYPVWVVLDRIMDPHNLGAIIRTAHFLGAQGVIATIENSSGPTPTVSKTSAGALEIMGLYQVQGLSSFLSRCKQNGWLVLGTGFGSTATPLEKITENEASLKRPTLLVLGNEGSGLTSTVQETCDALVEIPASLASPPDALESSVGSLNVSVATGILLHALLTPRRRRSRSSPVE